AGSSNEPVAQAIQPQLAQAGIRAKLVPTTQADLGPQFRAGSIDIMAAATGVQPDPSGMLGVYFLGGDKLVPDADAASFKALADKALDPRLTAANRAAAYKPVWKAIS